MLLTAHLLFLNPSCSCVENFRNLLSQPPNCSVTYLLSVFISFLYHFFHWFMTSCVLISLVMNGSYFLWIRSNGDAFLVRYAPKFLDFINKVYGQLLRSTNTLVCLTCSFLTCVDTWILQPLLDMYKALLSATYVFEMHSSILVE